MERPSNRGRGLALFLSRSLARHFAAPVSFAERTVVGDSFHLKPLLQMLAVDGFYYVLALCAGGVRLFEASREALREMDLGSTPRSLPEALRHDEHGPPSLRPHAGGRFPAGIRRAAAFHGQGDGSDDAWEELERFLRAVDDGVHGLLAPSDAPLVLVASQRVQAAYRHVSRYPGLLDVGVGSSPEGLDAAELTRRTWPLVEPVFRRARDLAVARYLDLSRTDRTTDDLRVLLPASCAGRVEVLFVAADRSVWGRYHPGEDRAEVHAERQSEDDDLLDLVATECLRTGGTVHAMKAEELPSAQPAAAILRYAG